MEELCTACLCSGRKLLFITETKYETLFSQIINEIPLYNVSNLRIRICWECKALLKTMDQFKEKAKRSYMRLLEYVEQNSSVPLCSPRLQTHRIEPISYPLPITYSLSIKKEFESDDIRISDIPIISDWMMNGDERIYSDDDTHCEPETFVKDWDLKGVDRKEPEKKVKSIKVKSKKKSKIKNIKDIKRKVKKKDDKSPLNVKQKIEKIDENYEQNVTVRDELTLGIEKERDVIKDEDSPGNVEDLDDKLNTKYRKVSKVKESLTDKPTCAECGKTFSSKKTYKYHINVLHKGQNRHPCPRCGKVYQWKSNLGRHLRSHKAVDEDELYCEKCDRRFASVATFRQHLKLSKRHISESEFSYVCSHCGKKFVTKTRLRDHIDWEHLKKIKFTCQKCNKAFKCHTSLYVHLQSVHSATQKVNLCHVCGKSYQNSAKLKYHIVAMHSGETPHRCGHCPAAFGWYSSLYRHVREVHYKMKTQPKKNKKPKKPELLPPLSLPPSPSPSPLQPDMLQHVHQPGPA